MCVLLVGIGAVCMGVGVLLWWKRKRPGIAAGALIIAGALVMLSRHLFGCP